MRYVAPPSLLAVQLGDLRQAKNLGRWGGGGGDHIYIYIYIYERPSKLALMSFSKGRTSVYGLVAFHLQNDMGHAENDNPNMVKNICEVGFRV